MGESLWRLVVHEIDTLLNAAFQSGFACLEKLLLLLIDFGEYVGGLLCPRRLKHN